MTAGGAVCTTSKKVPATALTARGTTHDESNERHIMNATNITSAPVFFPGTDFAHLEEDHFTIRIDRSQMPSATVHQFFDLIEDGVERRYFSTAVSDTEVTLESLSDQPCAVTWCVGHQANEADTWEGLQHRGEDLSVAMTGRRAEGVVSFFRVEKGADSGLYLDLAGAGQISVAEADEVADRLVDAAAKLRSLAASIRN